MGPYYGLCLLWIFAKLVDAETRPSTVAVPPLQVRTPHSQIYWMLITMFYPVDTPEANWHKLASCFGVPSCRFRLHKQPTRGVWRGDFWRFD